MKKSLMCVAICLFIFSFLGTGCGTKKVKSSGAAIETSQAMKTTQEKVDYLIKQAKIFYDSKNFKETMNIAYYILHSVDKDSLDAKDLVEKTKQELANMDQKKTVN